MQSIYEVKGKLFIEEGSRELTELCGDVLENVSFTHGDAPTPDQPAAWSQTIAHRVDMALLEQVNYLSIVLLIKFILSIDLLVIFLLKQCSCKK